MRPETILLAACGTAALVLAAYVGLELDRPAKAKGAHKKRLKRATGDGSHLGGLLNSGVTCYMNCVLQALASSECLQSWIRAGEGEAAASPDGRPVTRELLALLGNLNQRSVSPHSYSTEGLVGALAELYGRSSDSKQAISRRFVQQDAHEFLQLLTAAVADEAHASSKVRLQTQPKHHKNTLCQRAEMSSR